MGGPMQGSAVELLGDGGEERMKRARFAVLALAIAAITVVGATPASATRRPTVRLYLSAGHLSGPIDLDTGVYHMTGKEIGLHEGIASVVVDGTTVPDAATVTSTSAGGTISSVLGANLATDPGRCPTDVGVASGAFKFIGTFTGGTGRFAGASGRPQCRAASTSTSTPPPVTSPRSRPT